MKVLVADKFEKVGIDGLKELGCTVVSEPDVKADGLPELIQRVDPHILIVRSKKVNADALRAGTALTLVIRAGAGIDRDTGATPRARSCRRHRHTGSRSGSRRRPGRRRAPRSASSRSRGGS